ncbi:MAG: hypothetical protein WB565_10980 [Acidimicrobiales bacterium]
MNDREEAVAVLFREVIDGVTIREGVASGTQATSVHARVEAWARGRRPDVPPGIANPFEVISFYQLARLIISRCYRHGVPLVAWDIPWHIGRIAGYAGRSAGGAFSVCLAGCGVMREGRWKDSHYCPRIRLEARGGDQAGAFARWLAPRDKPSRSRDPGPFVDLQVASSAVWGGDVESLGEAATLFGIPFQDTREMDDLDRARASCAAAVQIYLTACRRLQELAPGLPIHKAWSTGSLVSHARRSAKIRPAAEAVKGLDAATKGAMAGAFGGPRVEAALVGIACPMVLVDLRGTFPGCFSALGLTRFQIAESIEVHDATEEFRAFLDEPVLVERLLDPEVVRYWGPAVVLVNPSAGASLYATVEWDKGRTGSTVAPMSFEGSTGLPWHWSDAGLAKASGGSFTVQKVFRFIPRGFQRVAPYRLPDGSLVDLRKDDLGVAWRDSRERMGGSLPKLGANSDTFGLPARYDRKRLDRPVDLMAVGPEGKPLTVPTRTPEYPATDTSLLLAGAVSAWCRMVVGLTVLDLQRVGGTVAHIACDSLAIPASPEGGLWPCPGGAKRLADGRPAIHLVSFDEVRRACSRADAVLGHRGGPAWKEECNTLTEPTTGTVFGVNKLVLARPRCDGSWEVVRSSDADLGGHVFDPTGTGRRTADGRWWWAAELERHLLRVAVETEADRPLTVPGDLPALAYRLALHTERATTWSELQRLRRDTGDPAVMPFARSMRAETGGNGGAPVVLGHHPDPESWSDSDFRRRGESVALLARDTEGDLQIAAGRPSARRQVVVRTVADHLARWLRERDPSMAGPPRGLRTPVPVETDASLVHVVARRGEPLSDGTEGPSVVFGRLPWAELWDRAKAIGAPEVARLGDLSRRTVSEVLSGGAEPTDATVAAIADAVARSTPRCCPHCGGEVKGRSDKRFCTDRCQKAARRAAVRDDIRATRESLSGPNNPRPADRTWVERDPRWIATDAPSEAS